MTNKEFMSIIAGVGSFIGGGYGVLYMLSILITQ
ncbi:hypothetical protein BN2127_JRS1_00938 [Bacillus cereus]|nr:hypothetical protein BN2127_JRS1_00938 [Bacillus cereus]